MKNELGIACTTYFFCTSLLPPSATGKLTGIFDRILSASAGFSSTFTPMSVKPTRLYFWYICSSRGISCRHGPHQLAQKLIITTWPRNCDSETDLPSRVDSVKSGAICVLAPANDAAANTTTHAASRTQ